MKPPRTLFDKLWDAHAIADAGEGASLIAIDRVLLHERTGGVALKSLAEAGHSLLDPSRVFAIMDHIVSFREGRGRDETRSPGGDVFITETRRFAQAAGISLIDTDDARQGIVHVIAPELGLALPGLSLVCPDSHTCSLGALGAFAIGIGSSQAEHAMATGALRLNKPSQMRVRIEGTLGADVSAKDLALYIIAKYGSAGGQRMAIEYAGSAIDAMDLEARLTLCNLAVEFSAFTAIIAPDEKVFAAIEGKPYAPDAGSFAAVQDQWKTLHTDDDAEFDEEIIIDASQVRPLVSWGTSPDQSIMIDGHIPKGGDPEALDYMGLKAGDRLLKQPIGGAFIGSCTNGRLSDLRAAAAVLKGRKVASGVRAICVPGSQSVRAAAEAEGLDVVFRQAGFEWGAPGCAMCFYAGGETFAPATRVMSSTNRNFRGRQGPSVRTHLASPATVAASAVMGRIADVASLEALEVI